jgi:hypothetical protein
VVPGLLNCKAGTAGPNTKLLMSDGMLVLSLHNWDAHEHPHMGGPRRASLWVKRLRAGPLFNTTVGH